MSAASTAALRSTPWRRCLRGISWGLIALIALYRAFLRPLAAALGVQCRYHPSCSVYAEASLKKYGPFVGGWRSLGRIFRCHPFAAGGFDPP